MFHVTSYPHISYVTARFVLCNTLWVIKNRTWWCNTSSTWGSPDTCSAAASSIPVTRPGHDFDCAQQRRSRWDFTMTEHCEIWNSLGTPPGQQRRLAAALSRPQDQAGACLGLGLRRPADFPGWWPSSTSSCPGQARHGHQGPALLRPGYGRPRKPGGLLRFGVRIGVRIAYRPNRRMHRVRTHVSKLTPTDYFCTLTPYKMDIAVCNML